MQSSSRSGKRVGVYLTALILGAAVGLVALPGTSSADEDVYASPTSWYGWYGLDFTWNCNYLRQDVWCNVNDHFNLRKVQAAETADQGSNSVCVRTRQGGDNVAKACAQVSVELFLPNIAQQRPAYKWGCCDSPQRQALNIIGYGWKR